MLNQEMKGLVSTLMIARKEFIEYKLLDSSSVPKEMWERSHVMSKRRLIGVWE